jgi:DNA (cytosine-5)-methyltransferase 1
MGFDDEDFEKAKAAGISNTQLYKQAGNSIVVQVLERIFERLIETQGIGENDEQCGKAD